MFTFLQVGILHLKKLKFKNCPTEKYIPFLLIKNNKNQSFFLKVVMLNAGKGKTGTPMPRQCDFKMAETWWVTIWQKVSRDLKYAWSLTQIEFYVQKFIIKKLEI